LSKYVSNLPGCLVISRDDMAELVFHGEWCADVTKDQR
jgi:hypothetical protein